MASRSPLESLAGNCVDLDQIPAPSRPISLHKPANRIHSPQFTAPAGPQRAATRCRPFKRRPASRGHMAQPTAFATFVQPQTTWPMNQCPVSHGNGSTPLVTNLATFKRQSTLDPRWVHVSLDTSSAILNQLPSHRRAAPALFPRGAAHAAPGSNGLFTGGAGARKLPPRPATQGGYTRTAAQEAASPSSWRTEQKKAPVTSKMTKKAKDFSGVAAWEDSPMQQQRGLSRQMSGMAAWEDTPIQDRAHQREISRQIYSLGVVQLSPV